MRRTGDHGRGVTDLLNRLRRGEVTAVATRAWAEHVLFAAGREIERAAAA